MIYNLKILPLALNDIKEISIWYEEVQKGLGKRFVKSFKNEVVILKVKPHLFQNRYDETKVALIESFPYLIHFEINNTDIVIKAVIHTSRNNKIWKNRKEY
jgi:ParE toxin of type II toxin-antitoxin system, parDE